MRLTVATLIVAAAFLVAGCGSSEPQYSCGSRPRPWYKPLRWANARRYPGWRA
jgi:hypothetical protein